jgi:hypothetical protein
MKKGFLTLAQGERKLQIKNVSVFIQSNHSHIVKQDVTETTDIRL